MKRVGFFFIMLILIVGMSAFAGGGGDRASAGGEKIYRVAIAMSPMTNPFHRTMYRFFEEAVEAAPSNYRFRFYFSDNSDVQVNNMELILAGNYDGVIVSTHDGNMMAEPTARIHRAGAKVVVVNRMLATTSRGEEWDAFVSGDNVDGGRNVARYMGNFLGGQGNIFIMGMQLGTPIANDRSSGFREVMAREFPNIRILGEVEAQHNIEAGFSAMQNVLQAHPRIDAVYSHDPFSAMGQEQAIINAGRRDIRLIMACAPDQSVVTHMRQNPNTIFRGNFAYPPSMAGQAVETMIKILNGERYDRMTIAPADLLMIEDLNQWANLVPSVTGR